MILQLFGLISIPQQQGSVQKCHEQPKEGEEKAPEAEKPKEEPETEPEPKLYKKRSIYDDLKDT